MLSEETTIGIYPNGELNDVLIVPDGHEYHLFLTSGGKAVVGTPSNLGSIVFINNDWIYEGDSLSASSQKEIADYIINYPGLSEEQSAFM